MDDCTGAHSPCASTEVHLPPAIVQLQDVSATPRSLSSHDSMTDDTKLPPVEQPNSPNNCIIIIQNNYIAEGGTINIFSSHCDGPVVTKYERVTVAAEPTPMEPPSMTQAEPAKHGLENIVLSGNTFGECAMINVGSPNCTGAIKQTKMSSGMK